jgi:tetratricopeptide (TPR) repeat protein
MVSSGNLARFLLLQDRFPEAEEAVGRQLAHGERLVGLGPANEAHARQYLDGVNAANRELREAGRHAEAERLWRRAIAFWEQRPPSKPRARSLAVCQNNLGVALEEAGRRPEAVELYRRAATQNEARLAEGPDDRDATDALAINCSNLAAALLELKQLPEAAQAARRSLEAWQQSVARAPSAAERWDGLLNAMQRLGDQFAGHGHADVALPVLRGAVEWCDGRAAATPTDPLVRMWAGFARNRLAIAYHSGRRYPEAEALHRKLFAEQEKLTGELPDHARLARGVAISLQNVSSAVWQQGRREEALALTRELLTRRERLAERFPEDVVCREQLGHALHLLAARLVDLGRRSEAAPLLRRAAEARAKLVADAPKNLQRRREWIETLLLARDHAAAAREAQELARLAPRDGDGNFSWAALFLRRCARTAGNDPALPEPERHALAGRYEQLALDAGQEHYRRRPGSPVALSNLATSLATAVDGTPREVDKALPLARRAAERRPDRRENHSTLGVVLYRAGRWKESAAALEEGARLTRPTEEGAFTHALYPVHLAMARWQLGEKDAARKLLAQARGWAEKHLSESEEFRALFDEAAALIRP